jgi:4-hydroxy-3-methylbut-2-enyl diphosphate reductase
LAQHSGYCFGVRRALNRALEARNDEKPVSTLGEIIHNPQIVQKLADKGIR